MYTYQITIPSYTKQSVRKLKNLTDEQKKLIEGFRDYLLIRNNSKKTISTYISDVQSLYLFVNDKHNAQINSTSVMSYFHFKKEQSSARKNQIKASFIKYLNEYLGENVEYLKRLKIVRSKPLPSVFSVTDVQNIINSTESLKYKLFFMFAYGCGLRLNEICNLKFQDIDRQEMKVFVSKGKGSKQRYVMLPKKILETLTDYYHTYFQGLDVEPIDFIFQNNKGQAMSGRSAETTFNQSKKIAKVDKKGCIHTLRHSFATHLLNNDTPIDSISLLLGHNSVETTMIYTKCANRKLNVDLLDSF